MVLFICKFLLEDFVPCGLIVKLSINSRNHTCTFITTSHKRLLRFPLLGGICPMSQPKESISPIPLTAVQHVVATTTQPVINPGDAEPLCLCQNLFRLDGRDALPAPQRVTPLKLNTRALYCRCTHDWPEPAECLLIISSSKAVDPLRGRAAGRGSLLRYRW